MHSNDEGATALRTYERSKAVPSSRGAARSSAGPAQDESEVDEEGDDAGDFEEMGVHDDEDDDDDDDIEG